MEDQLTTNVRRSRRTHEQIQNLLSEFSESGSTVRQFCRQHNLSSGTFHKWQSRHKSRLSKKSNGPGFTSLLIDPSSSRLFAEVKGIRIFQPVSAAYLKELLA